VPISWRREQHSDSSSIHLALLLSLELKREPIKILSEISQRVKFRALALTAPWELRY
jgi:hypothetical protein